MSCIRWGLHLPECFPQRCICAQVERVDVEPQRAGKEHWFLRDNRNVCLCENARNEPDVVEDVLHAALVTLTLRVRSGKVEISVSFTSTEPSEPSPAGAWNRRKSLATKDDLPAPVRPTTPTCKMLFRTSANPKQPCASKHLRHQNSRYQPRQHAYLLAWLYSEGDGFERGLQTRTITERDISKFYFHALGSFFEWPPLIFRRRGGRGT